MIRRGHLPIKRTLPPWEKIYILGLLFSLRDICVLTRRDYLNFFICGKSLRGMREWPLGWFSIPFLAVGTEFLSTSGRKLVGLPPFHMLLSSQRRSKFKSSCSHTPGCIFTWSPGHHSLLNLFPLYWSLLKSLPC